MEAEILVITQRDMNERSLADFLEAIDLDFGLSEIITTF